MIEKIFTANAAKMIVSLATALHKLRQEKKLEIASIEKTFGPLDYFVPYYISPYGQNVNPADVNEDDTGLVAKTNIIDLLNCFLASRNRYVHAFILSDAGMGKTSLLVMLKLLSLNSFIKPKHNIKLFKLDENTIEEIKKINLEPSKTILLLDGLDEDPEAWSNFYIRISQILSFTQNFRKVIISCRTQFFPQEYEEDGRIPGQVIIGGFHCSKLFLSPFSDNQVRQYLKKRIDDKNEIIRANAIITKMNYLKFRPMLLSYIDYLLAYDRSYDNAFDIYEALVDEWLNRELRKGLIPNKKVLRNVCISIAIYLYESKKLDISQKELKEAYLNVDSGLELKQMPVEGRSLLHKTSTGRYKFAHYSILEYLVTVFLLSSKRARIVRSSDQIKSFIIDTVIHKNNRDLTFLDLTNSNMNKFELKGVDFSYSKLPFSSLENSSLQNCNLLRCDIHESSLSNTKIEGSSFWGTEFDKSKFLKVEFSSSNLIESSLAKSNISDTNFTTIEMARSKLSESKINKVNFHKVDLSHSTINNSMFHLCCFRESNLEGCNMFKTSFLETRFVNTAFGEANLTEATLE